jgi:hypothetical protein
MDRRAYRVGGRAALARAFFNVLQPLYLVLMSTFVFKTEASWNDPTIISANRFWFYLDVIPLVGMAFSLAMMTWLLYDLLEGGAPYAMRLSLFTGLTCAGVFLLIAGFGVAQGYNLPDIAGFTEAEQRLSLLTFRFSQGGLGQTLILTQGLSTLLWGFAAMRSGILPKAMGTVAVIVGAFCLVMGTPVSITAFMLQIPLFIWLGLVLLQRSKAVWATMSPEPAT